MRIYFSGLGGAGIGPAARLARDLGYEVLGSDKAQNAATDALKNEGVNVFIGQDGSQISGANNDTKIDWLVHTPALPADHPEIVFAKKNDIKTTKAEDFINFVIEENNLKLIACSGTHGKTTATSMMIWLFKQFDLPVSYLVGTSLNWGANGQYQKGSEYLVLEADEYDRKFLELKPNTAIISSIDYDHPDTYPTHDEYKQAFKDFISYSHCAYLWKDDAMYIDLDGSMPNCAHAFGAEVKLKGYKLIGEHNRHNAFLVAQAFKEINPDISYKQIIDELNNFPGTMRRFEKLSNNIYTDYAHHPVEIKATIQLAKEVGKSVIAVYQPHQNVRQVQLLKEGGYGDAFKQAAQVFWLATFLTREDPELEIVTPQALVDTLDNKKHVDVIEDMDALTETIKKLQKKHVILIMGAGDIDDWARQNFSD